MKDIAPKEPDAFTVFASKSEEQDTSALRVILVVLAPVLHTLCNHLALITWTGL